jgi:hypothetical protein
VLGFQIKKKEISDQSQEDQEHKNKPHAKTGLEVAEGRIYKTRCPKNKFSASLLIVIMTQKPFKYFICAIA